MIQNTHFEHRYSDGIHHSCIAVLGIYPPPLGGVSVHIQRVTDKLAQQHNKINFFDTEQPLRRRWWLWAYIIKLMAFLAMKRPTIVYFHSGYVRTSWADLVALAMMRRFLKYQLVIVEHDCRHLYLRMRLFKKIYQWVLKRVDKLVLIGQRTMVSYVDNKLEMPEETSIEGAFVPPVMYNNASIMENYPSSLFIFIKDHTPIILMNASNLMMAEGKDVYGLDSAIAAMATIKNTYPDAGLLIALASVGTSAYLQVLRERMKTSGVTENVYILHNNQELWPLFKYADIFIRPTRSDGASISLQEALYFKIPAIASDVCVRPAGVVLYRAEMDGDLSEVMEKVLRERVYRVRVNEPLLSEKAL